MTTSLGIKYNSYLMEEIRNFSIIAHIDHGKSTLADRLLEFTGTISEREKVDQFLDQMDIERERGITIKAQAVRMHYRARDGKVYTLNLIDTPGHVDFSYEVSRSLAACEGAILVVDASQGVEAQTLAHVYTAIDNDLEVFPVINKIDLPNADPERVKREIEEIIGLDASDAVLISAKKGTGIEDLLEAIVKRIPRPQGSPQAPLKALVFDSWYDPYHGVVAMVRVFDGRIEKGMRIFFMSNGKAYEVEKVGVFHPRAREVDSLKAGEVGFITAGIKSVRDTKIGDTITEERRPTPRPLPGFKVVKPMVFSGFYPVDTSRYDELRDAMEKLSLNDSSFTFEPENSVALGFGFRCGFLGLLHKEIIQERLEREYGIDLITTAPSVAYRVVKKDGSVITVETPAHLPPEKDIDRIEEPFILATIHLPKDYIGQVIQLCEERRGVQKDIRVSESGRAVIEYELPLSEVILDFFDRLKSLTRGYGSLDYEPIGYRPSDLIKLNILINGEVVDALSLIIHRDKAYYRGRELVEKVKEVVPRQLFEVVIQAAIGSRIIARASVKPLRKNVTAKCYGGDVTRKRKLLERQKEGKKRMKRVGRVDIPQEAFLAILKVG